MLDKLEKEYKGKVSSLFLTTSKYAPAFKFYKKKGFKDSKKTVYMKKRLR